MRSLLFTPGDSDRKLAKGLTSGADVILIDLEDAVASDNKAAAREKVANFLGQEETRKAQPPLYVRINDLETEWAEGDLERIVPAKPAGIMLPKARSQGDVETLAGMLDTLEQRGGLEQGQIDRRVDVARLFRPQADEALQVPAVAYGNDDPGIEGRKGRAVQCSE